MKEKENAWLGQPHKIGMGNVKRPAICEMHPKTCEGRSAREVANFF